MTTDAADELLATRPDDARRRVDDALASLPPGFSVVRDIALPQPSRAIVQHLVVGPRNVWSVTTIAVDEPVAVGHGRNDDTLFAGQRPLRPELEAADWEAEALSGTIGHQVEPIVVLVAPSLPADEFDFHGIRVCDPEALGTVVTRPTATFVDVEDVIRTVERAYGVTGIDTSAIPRLGHAVQPPSLRAVRDSRSTRRRFTPRHRLRSRRRPGVRAVVVAAIVAAAVIGVPTIRAIWDAVVDEGTGLVTGDAGVSAEEIGEFEPVVAALACPQPGGGWQLVLQWPGPPPDGVAGYGVRTETAGAASILHTPTPWSDPVDPPGPIDVTWDGPTTVHTDLRNDDGAVIASTSEVLPAPPSTC